MAEESNILSWTPANMVTVVLMVVLTYAIVGAIVRIVQQRRAAKGAAA